MSVELVLLGLLALAGFYMAWNIGANDVANAMGTSVGSGALTLRRAVILAAIFEFSGAFFFGSNVTDTIQKGIISPLVFENRPEVFLYGMLSALLSAGIWLQIASYFGWPVSTTHAIVGAVIGFGVVVGGFFTVEWSVVISIMLSWIFSPLLGGCLGFFLFMFLRKKIFYREKPLDQARRWMPVFAAFVVLVMGLSVSEHLFNKVLSERAWLLEKLILLSVVVAVFVLEWLWMKRIRLSKEPSYSTDRPITLEMKERFLKARKHLSLARQDASKEVGYQIDGMLDEIGDIVDRKALNQETQSISAQHQAVESVFSHLQILSACLMAFAHGANDVANAIGPLAASVNLIDSHSFSSSAPVPTWTLALGGVGIVIGLATWGWRVIETVGKKITELTPSRGFSAEFAAALVVLFASWLGFPISATHTLVGAVLGVGFARGLEAINLSVTKDIVISWAVTLPVGAVLSVIIFYIIQAAFSPFAVSF